MGEPVVAGGIVVAFVVDNVVVVVVVAGHQIGQGHPSGQFS